jgi:LacI family transcriptional regulator
MSKAARPRASQQHEVTIFDVAQRAGVGIATVSRVLSGRHSHAEKTRRAVQEAARALRYQPNAAARNLSARTTDLIAVCGWFLGDNEETFPAELVLKGIMAHLRGTRYGIFMVQRRGEPGDHKEFLRDLSRQRFVSGSILINSLLPQDAPSLVRGSRVPLVQVETHFSGTDSVVCDNALGGRLGLRHLLQLGRRRPVMLIGPPYPAQAERVKGCRESLSQAGLGPKAVRVFKAPDHSFEGGLAMARQLLQARARGEKIDSAFSLAGDKTALGLIQGLKDQGLRVPKDLAVLGYDGIPESAYSDPALSTVKQPLFQMGAEAARLLCERLEAPQAPFQCVKLAPTLIERASA